MEWNVIRTGVVASTNDEARRLALDGAAEGTVVVAEGQNAGRGRLGRNWYSPEGKGLYASVILRPQADPAAIPTLTLMAGLAVSDALTGLVSESAQLKWPNDIWIGGRKVCGILSEWIAQAQPTPCVVIGIGINVNIRAEEFPDDLQHPATSLALVRGQPLDRTVVLESLLPVLSTRYAQWQAVGWAGLREEYVARSAIEGLQVRVTFNNDQHQGTVRGVNDQGALLLEVAPGRHEAIVAGDVELLKE